MTGLITEHGRAVGVHTEHGDIRAEVVVLCPGMWGRDLGLMTGIDLPLQAAEHYYLISEPIAGLHNKLPILRDPGRAAYAREEAARSCSASLSRWPRRGASMASPRTSALTRSAA